MSSETFALRMAWLRDVAKPARMLGKLLRGLTALFLFGHALLFLIILVASLTLLRVNPPFTALMVYRRLIAHQTSQPVKFVPLRQIPRVARNMVIRLEDYRFYEHAGVDLGAIRDAYEINESIGRTVVGGSTIPMQLARNLFLTPRKTYFRKYVESLIALEMDLILPKDRILELYLNNIEWGRGIFGIGAASSHYYKAGVGSLSLDQLRRLITILTNPIAYNVQTYYKSAQMAERYAYLVSRFPDPSSEATGTGAVAPVPDAPAPSAPAQPQPAASSVPAQPEPAATSAPAPQQPAAAEPAVPETPEPKAAAQ